MYWCDPTRPCPPVRHGAPEARTERIHPADQRLLVPRTPRRVRPRPPAVGEAKHRRILGGRSVWSDHRGSDRAMKRVVAKAIRVMLHSLTNVKEQLSLESTRRSSRPSRVRAPTCTRRRNSSFGRSGNRITPATNRRSSFATTYSSWSNRSFRSRSPGEKPVYNPEKDRPSR